MVSNLVFVGTYTDLVLQTGPGDSASEDPSPTGSKGIYVFSQDTGTGELTLLHTCPDVVNPSFLALNGAQNMLFAVNETKELNGDATGAVSSFSIVPVSGELRLINSVPSGGCNPCHLAVSTNGRYLYVANWESASVAVIPIDEDGRLSQLVDLHVDDATDDRPPHAHFISPDPDGQFVLSTNTGTDRVMIYRPDSGNGALIPGNPAWVQTHAGGGPRHLAFHPSGEYLFANGEADLTLSVFRYDAEHGQHRHLESLSTVPDGVSGNEHTTAQIVAHPNGRFVYVSNRGTDSIAMFSFDVATERAKMIGTESTHGTTPRNFMVDPAGRYLYAANQNSNAIELFAIDELSGLLRHVDRAANVPAPTCIVFANV